MTQMNTDPIRAAALKEIRAVLALHDAQPGTTNTIHQLRVCTKKLRGYLRAYPGKVAIRKTNRQLKALADSYSESRDSYVLSETLQQLVAGWSVKKREKYQDVIDAIVAQEVKGGHESSHLDPRLAFERILTSWPYVGNDQDFWAVGLDRIYIKAQLLGEAAIRSNEDEPYHRWRKWVKYWLYGLSGIAKGKVTGSYRKQLKRLGDALGYFHDLCILEVALLEKDNKDRFGSNLNPFLKNIASEKKGLKKSFKKAYKVLFKMNYRKRQKMVGRAK